MKAKLFFAAETNAFEALTKSLTMMNQWLGEKPNITDVLPTESLAYNGKHYVSSRTILYKDKK